MPLDKPNKVSISSNVFIFARRRSALFLASEAKKHLILCAKPQQKPQWVTQDRKMPTGCFLWWNVDDCCTCDTNTHGFHFSVYSQEPNSPCRWDIPLSKHLTLNSPFPKPQTCLQCGEVIQSESRHSSDPPTMAQVSALAIPTSPPIVGCACGLFPSIWLWLRSGWESNRFDPVLPGCSSQLQPAGGRISKEYRRSGSEGQTFTTNAADSLSNPTHTS